jgi:hypothetical protein
VFIQKLWMLVNPRIFLMHSFIHSFMHSLMDEQCKKSCLRASRVAQVAEHLPSKLKDLSSNPSTSEKKKQGGEKQVEWRRLAVPTLIKRSGWLWRWKQQALASATCSFKGESMTFPVGTPADRCTWMEWSTRWSNPHKGSRDQMLKVPQPELREPLPWLDAALSPGPYNWGHCMNTVGDKSHLFPST